MEEGDMQTHMASLPGCDIRGSSNVAGLLRRGMRSNAFFRALILFDSLLAAVSTRSCSS